MIVKILYKNRKSGEMCQRKFFFYDEVKEFLELISCAENLQLETITETKLCVEMEKTSVKCIYRRA